MQAIIKLACTAQCILDYVRKNFDFVGAALLRLYLVPVFWVAGQNKWNPFDSDSSLDGVIGWFDSMGMPFPTLNAYLAWGAEYLGAVLLALGLATRWACIPLMFTMIVAATTVHWDNGWQAVHDANSPHASATVGEAIERLDRAKSILREHGNYGWLTEHGGFLVSNNGIEWAATYFVLLLALFFIGGGRFISLDYWIGCCRRRLY
ncbi:MAG: HvfX family Cu-binding RiPP maturation protein [Gammaproteobacteria bacterium]